MGLFGKTQKIDHDFFGEMIFVGTKNPSPTDYFECSRHFRPTKQDIELGVDADIAGPGQNQVDFFKTIEDNYEAITEAIIPLLENEFGNWKDGFKISNFREEFEPVYIRLPRCEANPVIWEIAFESDHDRNHTFTLVMNEFEASEIMIDG